MEKSLQLSALDKNRVGEAYHLWQTVGGDVWPGWMEEMIPCLLVSDELYLESLLKKALEDNDHPSRLEVFETSEVSNIKLILSGYLPNGDRRIKLWK